MGNTVDIQQAISTRETTAFRKYQDLVVGRPGLWALIKHELIVMLSAGRTGALGFWLRSRLLPLLLGSCGRGVRFGTHVVLRHPHKIHLADGVVIDDNCLLDAKGDDNAGIRIGAGAFLGRNTILSCKNGDIVLGDRVNVGFNCEIFSGSRVQVGSGTLLAAYCYLIGGGHDMSDPLAAPLDQARTSLGITVGAGAWLGAGVKVLDGVTLGDGVIVGAGAVVTGNVASRMIVAGIPAHPVRSRIAE